MRSDFKASIKAKFAPPYIMERRGLLELVIMRRSRRGLRGGRGVSL